MFKKINSKKIFPILMAIVIAGIFFGFFAPNKAAAEIWCKDTHNNAQDPRCIRFPDKDVCPGDLSYCDPSPSEMKMAGTPNECDSLWKAFSMACMLWAADNITYYAVWTPANIFLSIGGYAMNKSIDFSVSGPVFGQLANSEAINKGWGLSRDIVNLFLIFILLYIAIATILQISGYGAKELLTTLIIVAFLVNFSSVITKLVIDASNVLAIGFYNSFDKDPKTGDIGISETFSKAFDFEKIMTKKDSTPGATGQNLYLVEFLSYLLGAVIAFIAGFIFLIFGILFLIRMVSLLLIIVFSPLAFAAHILPSTKKHASKWWGSLFSQAFFAPAALFVLWLSAQVANSSFIKTSLRVGKEGLSDMLVVNVNTYVSGAALETQRWQWDNIMKFVLNFVIIIILLCASLIIAKQMGAMGAESVIAGGKKLARKAQGYAGRITARTAIARPARLLAESGLAQKAAARVARVPILRRAFAGVQAAAKVGGLDDITKRRVALGESLPPEQRAEYMLRADRRTKQELFRKISARERAEALQKQPGLNSLLTALPVEEREKTEKEQKEVKRKDIVKELENINTPLKEFKEKIKQLKPEEAEKLNKDIFENPEKLAVMVESLSGAHAAKIYSRGDEATDAFFKHLASLGNDIEEVSAKLVKAGNRSLAAWVRTGGANKAILESYEMKPPPPQPEPQRPGQLTGPGD